MTARSMLEGVVNVVLESFALDVRIDFFLDDVLDAPSQAGIEDMRKRRIGIYLRIDSAYGEKQCIH